LIVRGKEDHLCPLEQHEELQKLLKNSKIIEIANCGHSPFWDLPTEIAKVINNFIDEKN
jgi:pimeloyl-ACP methyl ester carboxylesterase